jgi:hypothetical protein
MPTKAKIAALQAILAASQELRELKVVVEGEEEPLVFYYKPLTWLQKSRILSEATEYRPETKEVNGKDVTKVFVVLHQDVYNKLSLQQMLVNPPIPMSDTVLEGLPPEIGQQFEVIIPPPISTAGIPATKKE